MGTELATIPGVPLPSRVNSSTSDTAESNLADSSANTDLPLPFLPTEIVEMILDRVWRFEDQLTCRQVCKWWHNYISIVLRDSATQLPVNYYSFSPQDWICLDSNREILKRLEFRTCGRSTLREYDPLTHTLAREVKYEPNKEKVRVVIHDDFKRSHTIWHSDTYEIKKWTEFKHTQCAVL
jgi:hypothetical protein